MHSSLGEKHDDVVYDKRKMQTTTTNTNSKNAPAGILCIDQMESYERNLHQNSDKAETWN